MEAIFSILIPVGFKLLEFFLDKAKENKQAMENFYKFVDKIHSEYLNSAKMKVLADERWKKIKEKPFVESP